MYRLLEIRNFQIFLENCWFFKSGQYPSKSKCFVFKWWQIGFIEIRRFFTPKELRKWVKEGILSS